MNAPHVTVLPGGDVQLRLTPEDAKILAGSDTCKLWTLQSRFREKYFVASMEAALRSEAVS